MVDQRLDLLVLRLSVARDQGRLRKNIGLEIRVAAAQLAELALDGSLIDYEGMPTVVWSGARTDPLAPLLTRLQELAGWPWEQLLWRQGIDASALLKASVAELVADGTWARTASARPLRPAQYADLGGGELRAQAERLDQVITGAGQPTARESVLVALMALRFVNGNGNGAEWMQRYWVSDDDLEGLSERERVTVQQVIEAADGIAILMRGGGTALNAATMGGGT